MSMQINDIVIYSHDERKRVINLKPGKLNIITGKSATGKSALLDIVDYSLGARECNVADGVRRKISWFGLRLLFNNMMAFIARKCPPIGNKSCDNFYYIIGSEISIPELSELQAITNRDGVISLLSDWSGIQENIHEPSEMHTRLPLAAKINHALKLCS